MESLFLLLSCSKLGILLPIFSSELGSAMFTRSFSWMGSVLLLARVGRLGRSSLILHFAELDFFPPLRSIARLDLSLFAFSLSSSSVCSPLVIGPQHIDFMVLVQGLSCSGVTLSVLFSTSLGPSMSLRSFACLEFLILLFGAAGAGRCQVFGISVLDFAHVALLLLVQSSNCAGLSLLPASMSQADAFLSSHTHCKSELLLSVLGKACLGTPAFLLHFALLDFLISLQSFSCSGLSPSVPTANFGFPMLLQQFARLDLTASICGPACLGLAPLAAGVNQTGSMLLSQSLG